MVAGSPQPEQVYQNIFRARRRHAGSHHAAISLPLEARLIAFNYLLKHQAALSWQPTLPLDEKLLELYRKCQTQTLTPEIETCLINCLSELERLVMVPASETTVIVTNG